MSLVVTDGPFRGQRIGAANPILGKPGVDKVFAAGDKALVAVRGEDGQGNHLLPRINKRLMAA